jgi:CheY-like chemotaxis protein
MVVMAIADDATRREYTSCLTASGFTVLVASDGHEAVSLATRYFPEIVVLDLALQGLAPARRLRNEPLTAHVGIIALGSDMTEYRQRLACGAGCDAMLQAPCPAETLLTELLIMLAQVMPDEEGGGAAAETKVRHNA